jgi:glucose-6-phosphate-specific signal transduction histidine kinase
MKDLKKIESLFRRIDSITHENKTDKGYWEATEIATELLDEMPNNNAIKVDVKILKKYKTNGSEKSKKSVLDEFKQQSMSDVFRVINNLKLIPPTTIE